MVKPAEKSEAKPTVGSEVNGAQKPEVRKKPPPGKPYAIKRGFA